MKPTDRIYNARIVNGKAYVELATDPKIHATAQSFTEAIAKIKKKADDLFQAYYLDHFNDFLTINGYASYYGIDRAEALERIEIGRTIHQQRVLA